MDPQLINVLRGERSDLRSQALQSPNYPAGSPDLERMTCSDEVAITRDRLPRIYYDWRSTTRVPGGRERERKRGEEKEMSDSLRCVRECCPRDTVLNRSAIGPVFRTRRVSRQWLKSSYRKKIQEGGSLFFLFHRRWSAPPAPPLRPPSPPSRRDGTLSGSYRWDRMRASRRKSAGGEREAEDDGGEERGSYTKIATVYHHQVDIYALPLSLQPSLSLSLFLLRCIFSSSSPSFVFLLLQNLIFLFLSISS